MTAQQPDKIFIHKCIICGKGRVVSESEYGTGDSTDETEDLIPDYSGQYRVIKSKTVVCQKCLNNKQVING